MLQKLQKFQHYIDGEFSDALQTFDSINPASTVPSKLRTVRCFHPSGPT
jgi:hypothetical protein